MKNTMQSLEQAIKEFNEELAMYKKDYITIQAVLESDGAILFDVMDSIESWYKNDYRRELRNAKSRYKYAAKQGNKEKANKEFNIIMSIEYMERYIPIVLTRFNYALDCYKATDVSDRITYNIISTEEKAERIADEIVVSSLFHAGSTIDKEEALAYIEEHGLDVNIEEAVIAIKSKGNPLHRKR